MPIKKISEWINKKPTEQSGDFMKSEPISGKSKKSSFFSKSNKNNKKQGIPTKSTNQHIEKGGNPHHSGSHNKPNHNKPEHKKPFFNKSNKPDHQVKKHFPNDKKMRIIPLGGLEEVGKNIMAIEYGNDIIIIDAGMSFAGPEMLGVDFIVPDVTYLQERKHLIRGIIFTHGHLDHIGAAQYIIPKLGNPQLYATKLTAGLLKGRLKEFDLDKTAKIKEYTETTKLKLGNFEVEFFRVNHSIPDGMGLFIKSPAGTLVHTGDFKFDYAPAIDKPADLQRIAQIGARGIDVLMIDSTNATKPGYCRSEQEIANNIEDVIVKTKGRLIIASFSSLIGRIDQICNIAAKNNRKVFLSGRSMINNMQLAENLGFTTYPKGIVRKIGPQVNSVPPSQTIILTTGAQGESLSALTRMAIGEHSQVKIKEGDTVMISASPIPGNERAIVNVINNLYSQGAKVITNGDMDIHVSGHAHAEEIKLMKSLIKPKHYVPVHGEIHMRMGHAHMIKDLDPKQAINILDNGDVLEISKQGIRKSKTKIPANDILIDGLGFGDIGSKVMQERKIMSNDGTLIIMFNAYEQTKRLVAEPNIISRGFVYVKESDEIAHETKQVAKKAFEQIIANNRKISLNDLKFELGKNISRFIRKRLGREPMIIPIVIYI